MDWTVMMVYVWENTAKFGVIVAAVGVYLAVWTLRANHDWNRRQFTAKMIEDWNPRTSEHRRAIEKCIPGLVDKNKITGKAVELTSERAQEIYQSKPGSEDWQLRFHFIELLNYLEYIAACYYNSVGDRAMIEESFRNAYLMYGEILEKFIKEFGEFRRYEQPMRAWGPFHDLVAEWKRTPRRKVRRRPA